MDEAGQNCQGKTRIHASENYEQQTEQFWFIWHHISHLCLSFYFHNINWLSLPEILHVQIIWYASTNLYYAGYADGGDAAMY